MRIVVFVIGPRAGHDHRLWAVLQQFHHHVVQELAPTVALSGEPLQSFAAQEPNGILPTDLPGVAELVQNPFLLLPVRVSVAGANAFDMVGNKLVAFHKSGPFSLRKQADLFRVT